MNYKKISSLFLELSKEFDKTTSSTSTEARGVQSVVREDEEVDVEIIRACVSESDWKKLKKVYTSSVFIEEQLPRIALWLNTKPEKMPKTAEAWMRLVSYWFSKQWREFCEKGPMPEFQKPWIERMREEEAEKDKKDGS